MAATIEIIISATMYHAPVAALFKEDLKLAPLGMNFYVSWGHSNFRDLCKANREHNSGLLVLNRIDGPDKYSFGLYRDLDLAPLATISDPKEILKDLSPQVDMTWRKALSNICWLDICKKKLNQVADKEGWVRTTISEVEESRRRMVRFEFETHNGNSYWSSQDCNFWDLYCFLESGGYRNLRDYSSIASPTSKAPASW